MCGIAYQTGHKAPVDVTVADHSVVHSTAGDTNIAANDYTQPLIRVFWASTAGVQ